MFEADSRRLNRSISAPKNAASRGQFSHTRGPAPFQTSADTLNMRTCSHSHIPYVVCWRPVRPPRRVQGCAKMLSTGRPAYGRPAGHPHQHTRPVPGPSRRPGWALWHAGHPHPIWGHMGLEFSTGPQRVSYGGMRSATRTRNALFRSNKRLRQVSDPY